jgi:uncharacterized protein YbaP (TraB family)
MSQRRKILPMLVLLMMLCTIGAQTADDQSLLWKVSHPQSSHTSYIFGTIHLQDSTVFRQRDTVLTLLHTCTTFAAELHLDSAQKIMMNPGVIMRSSGSLYDDLDTPTVRRLMSLVEKRMPGLSALLPRLKPGALTALLAMGQHEATAPEAMDVFLWNLAKRKHRNTVGLEYVSEQIQLLDTMGVEGLRRIARDTANEDADALQRMIVAYRNENLDDLTAMASDTAVMAGNERESLNDDRNHRLVDRMIPLLERGRTFVAVGALHLTGSESVITLLRQRGWTVTPVIGGQRSQWLTPAYLRGNRY